MEEVNQVERGKKKRGKRCEEGYVKTWKKVEKEGKQEKECNTEIIGKEKKKRKKKEKKKEEKEKGR